MQVKQLRLLYLFHRKLKVSFMYLGFKPHGNSKAKSQGKGHCLSQHCRFDDNCSYPASRRTRTEGKVKPEEDKGVAKNERVGGCATTCNQSCAKSKLQRSATKLCRTDATRRSRVATGRSRNDFRFLFFVLDIGFQKPCPSMSYNI